MVIEGQQHAVERLAGVSVTASEHILVLLYYEPYVMPKKWPLLASGSEAIVQSL